MHSLNACSGTLYNLNSVLRLEVFFSKILYSLQLLINFYFLRKTLIFQICTDKCVFPWRKKIVCAIWGSTWQSILLHNSQRILLLQNWKWNLLKLWNMSLNIINSMNHLKGQLKKFIALVFKYLLTSFRK